jgi:hypothetical protein
LLIQVAAIMSVGSGGKWVSPGTLSAVERWLTERDYRVLAVLEEHFTFTTSQLVLIIHGVCRVACRSSHVDLLLVC